MNITSKRILRLVLAVFLSATLFACGGSDLAIGTTTNNDSSQATEDGLRVGNGLGTAFEVGVIETSNASLEAGETVTLNVSIVDVNGDPYTRDDVSVEFTSNCAAQEISEFSNPTTVTRSGFSTTQYTPNGCSGQDIITARVDDNDGIFDNTNDNRTSFVLVARVTLDITQDTVAAVDYLRPREDEDQLPRDQDLDDFNSVLSPPGASGSRTSEVTFKLVGTQGAAVIGETVTFSVTNTVGGVRIAPGRETAVSDNNGVVRTVAQSGTVSTSFAVQATHAASGNATLSDTMVVTGNIPLNERFSVSQSRFVVDALQTDGVSVGFGVIASDQFGNDIPDGSQIFFASPESGNIDSACEVESGECSVRWRSAGVRPLDGRVTIIAYTDGAEDFTDFNGNNVFDDADIPGLDLTEPFVDENENGVYEPGEFFVDTNLNGVWDMGNGEWDGPCLDQISVNANCNGEDSITIFKTRVIAMPVNNSVRLANIEITVDGSTSIIDDANPTLASPIDLTGGETLTIVVTALDGNPNATLSPPAPGTVIEVSLAGAAAEGVEPSPGSVTVGQGIQAEPFAAIFRITDPDATVNAGPARVDITLTPPVGGNTLTYSFDILL